MVKDLDNHKEDVEGIVFSIAKPSSLISVVDKCSIFQ